MRFELRSGEEVWLPVELVDCLDQMLLQDQMFLAVRLLCQQRPPEISFKLGVLNARHIIWTRQEWLKNHAAASLLTSAGPTDAV